MVKMHYHTMCRKCLKNSFVLIYIFIVGFIGAEKQNTLLSDNTRSEVYLNKKNTVEVTTPPNNDDVCNADPIFCDQTITGNLTQGATPSSIDSDIDIWYYLGNQLSGDHIDVVYGNIYEGSVSIYISDQDCNNIVLAGQEGFTQSYDSPAVASYTMISDNKVWIRCSVPDMEANHTSNQYVTVYCGLAEVSILSSNIISFPEESSYSTTVTLQLSHPTNNVVTVPFTFGTTDSATLGEDFAAFGSGTVIREDGIGISDWNRYTGNAGIIESVMDYELNSSVIKMDENDPFDEKVRQEKWSLSADENHWEYWDDTNNIVSFMYKHDGAPSNLPTLGYTTIVQDNSGTTNTLHIEYYLLNGNDYLGGDYYKVFLTEEMDDNKWHLLHRNINDDIQAAKGSNWNLDYIRNFWVAPEVIYLDDIKTTRYIAEFPLKSIEQTIDFSVFDDQVYEGDETFELILGTPTNAILSPDDPTTMVFTIEDNDIPINDEPCGAHTLTINEDITANLIDNATVTATPEYCGYEIPDVWFQITVPDLTEVSIYLNSLNKSGVAIYTDICSELDNSYDCQYANNGNPAIATYNNQTGSDQEILVRLSATDDETDQHLVITGNSIPTPTPTATPTPFSSILLVH